MEHIETPPEVQSWIEELSYRLLDYMRSHPDEGDSEDVASDAGGNTPDKQY